jgi:hypothetical protein
MDNIKQEFFEQTKYLVDSGEFDDSDQLAIWDWINSKLLEAQEYGFNAGCDYVDRLKHKDLVNVIRFLSPEIEKLKQLKKSYRG